MLWQTYTIADLEKQKKLLAQVKQINAEPVMPVMDDAMKTNY